MDATDKAKILEALSVVHGTLNAGDFNSNAGLCGLLWSELHSFGYVSHEICTFVWRNASLWHGTSPLYKADRWLYIDSNVHTLGVLNRDKCTGDARVIRLGFLEWLAWRGHEGILVFTEDDYRAALEKRKRGLLKVHDALARMERAVLNKSPKLYRATVQELGICAVASDLYESEDAEITSTLRCIIGANMAVYADEGHVAQEKECGEAVFEGRVINAHQPFLGGTRGFRDGNGALTDAGKLRLRYLRWLMRKIKDGETIILPAGM